MTESSWLICDSPVTLLQHLHILCQSGPRFVDIRPGSISDYKLRSWVKACRDAYSLREGRTHAWIDLHKYPEEIFSCAVTWLSNPGIQSLSMTDRAALLREVVGNHTLCLPKKLIGRQVNCVSCNGSGIGSLISSEGHGSNGRSVFARCMVCCGTGEVRAPHSWLTPTVLSLAHAAHDKLNDDRTLDTVRLAVLADALEDAGCDNEDLLRHLRGWEKVITNSHQCPICASNCELCDDIIQGNRRKSYACSGKHHWAAPHSWVTPVAGTIVWRPLSAAHTQGCWVLDLLLGRE
jgi:hypothetical protein